MEKCEENSYLASLRLPSSKTVLIGLIVFVATITLLTVYTSGRSVDNSMHVYGKNGYSVAIPSHRKSEQHSLKGSLMNQKPRGQKTGGAFTRRWRPKDNNDDIHRHSIRPSQTSSPNSTPRAERPKQDLPFPGNLTSRAIIDQTETADPADSTAKAKRKATKHAGLKSKNINIYYWNDTDRMSLKSLPLLHPDDRTQKKSPALIYNRVPKCGSRTVVQLLNKLSLLNKFTLVNSVVYNKAKINADWQRFIVRSLDRVKKPYLFQRHLHFVDFTNFGVYQPMYINLIRDPVERFVSNYYYKRFGDKTRQIDYKGAKEDKYRSVTDCIMSSNHECSEEESYDVIPYFCGQFSDCRKPSQWALDTAKHNVEKYFVAIGILEDLEGSLRVFEKLLPRYFKGVVKLFLEPAPKEVLKTSKFVTKKKGKASPEAVAKLKKLMHYQYDFYYFVKERLERAKEQYGIITTS